MTKRFNFSIFARVGRQTSLLLLLNTRFLQHPAESNSKYPANFELISQVGYAAPDDALTVTVIRAANVGSHLDISAEDETVTVGKRFRAGDTPIICSCSAASR